MIRRMLEITGLRKSYGALVAVAGLDLRVDRGEILALLGPNGAGKSTTVKCLVGLCAPDAGSIAVDGVDARADPIEARRRIGYLPENARLHEALTAREYLQLKGRLFDLDEARIAEASDRLLLGFGLGDRRDEPMAAFSKGMLQRVALAAALLTGPRLLVLDEPLSGLDVNSARLVKEVVREFARRGGGVLYCSHMLDIVEGLAHRVAVLDSGELLACGTLGELRKRTGAGEGARLDELFRRLTKADDPARAARAMLG
ncbi:MAG: ABC transporter ATP-binding protein [Planctomycetota bacterium]